MRYKGAAVESQRIRVDKKPLVTEIKDASEEEPTFALRATKAPTPEEQQTGGQQGQWGSRHNPDKGAHQQQQQQQQPQSRQGGIENGSGGGSSAGGSLPAVAGAGGASSSSSSNSSTVFRLVGG